MDRMRKKETEREEGEEAGAERSFCEQHKCVK